MTSLDLRVTLGSVVGTCKSPFTLQPNPVPVLPHLTGVLAVISPPIATFFKIAADIGPDVLSLSLTYQT